MNFYGKKMLVYALIGLLATPPTFLSTQAYATDVTGSIYQNGTIYTMTDTMEEAKNTSHKANQAEMVITDALGKIVYVGSADEAPDDLKTGKNVVDLKGKTMLPGFIDGHGHYPGFATTDLYGVNLYPTPIGSCDTMATMIERLKTVADKTPATYTSYGTEYVSVIQGSGYDDTLLDKAPTATQLDAASTDHYVLVSHISGHLSTVNTKLADAISNTNNEMIGKKLTIDKTEKTVTSVSLANNLYTLTFDDGSTKSYDGVKIVDGKMTGLLNELDAMGLANLFPAQGRTDAETQNIHKYASDTYAAAGVTTANQSIMFLNQLPSYRKYINDGDLKIRISAHPPAIETYGAYYMRKWLGWTNSNGVYTYDTVGPKSKGDDLTCWSPNTIAELTDLTDASTYDSRVGSGYTVVPADQLMFTIPKESITYEEMKALPPYRVFLSTHKTLIDGSNQGYTGYFKKDGYYDLTPDATHTYAPYDPAKDLYDPAANDRIPSAEGYEDQMWGTAGTLNLDRQTLQDTFNLYHSQGEPITVHANGSWANELVVSAIERAVMAYPNVKDSRHTIIHAQMQELLATQRLAGNYTDAIKMLDATAYDSLADVPDGGTGYVKNSKDMVQNGVIYYDVEGYASPDGYADIPDYPGGNENGAYYDATPSTQVTRDNINTLASLMKEQNIVSSYYVDHTYYWGDRHKNVFMGPGRANHISPTGWAVANDHWFTLHDDCPIVPILPLRLLESATTRIPYSMDYALSGTSSDITATTKEYVSSVDAENGTVANQKTFWDYDQRISVLQALLGLTQYGAYSLHAEKFIGTIEKDKFADFVILDSDPFNTDLTKLADIRVCATIVADQVAYGFLPTADEFASPVSKSLVQEEGTVVSNVTMQDLTDEEKETIKGLLYDGETSLGMHYFTAETTGTSATFEMTILGHGDKVNTLKLKKIINDTDDPYEYTLVDALDFSGNNFWISEEAFPNAALSRDTVLELDQYYVLRFVIQDNSLFDLDETVGEIEDPVSLVTTSTSTPTNGNSTASSNSGGGGSSGGCTAGTNTMHDMMFLVFAAFGLALFRVIRRRD